MEEYHYHKIDNVLNELHGSNYFIDLDRLKRDLSYAARAVRKDNSLSIKMRGKWSGFTKNIIRYIADICRLYENRTDDNAAMALRYAQRELYTLTEQMCCLMGIQPGARFTRVKFRYNAETKRDDVIRGHFVDPNMPEPEILYNYLVEMRHLISARLEIIARAKNIERYSAINRAGLKLTTYLNCKKGTELKDKMRGILENKKGKNVALVLEALRELRYLRVSDGDYSDLYEAIRLEFGYDIGSDQSINKYLAKNTTITVKDKDGSLVEKNKYKAEIDSLKQLLYIEY